MKFIFVFSEKFAVWKNLVLRGYTDDYIYNVNLPVFKSSYLLDYIYLHLYFGNTFNY